MNEALAEALAEIRRCGFEPTVTGRKHHKIHWQNREGKRVTLVISRTPSSAHALRNSRTVLRRLLRKATRMEET